MLIYKKPSSPEAVLEHLIDDTHGNYGNEIWIGDENGVHPETLGPTGAKRQKFKLTKTLIGNNRYLRKGSAGLADIHTLDLSGDGLQVVRLELYKGANTSFGFTPEHQGESDPLWLAAYGVHNYLNGLVEAAESKSVVGKIHTEYDMQDTSLRQQNSEALSVMVQQFYGHNL
jgi:hypothetical protein